MAININLFLIIFFYLLGSIPFGLIIPKIFGFGDIRNIGSGNIGATNVLRTGNKFLALFVLFLDMLKGLIPFIILSFYFNNIDFINKIFISHFAILGHIFPIWLKFKGGKGVATYIGFLFGINLYIGFSFIISWILIAFITRYSSLSSLIGSLIAPVYFIFVNNNNYIGIFLFYIFIIITVKHKENIKRLIKKTENKIKFSK